MTKKQIGLSITAAIAVLGNSSSDELSPNNYNNLGDKIKNAVNDGANGASGTDLESFSVVDVGFGIAKLDHTDYKVIGDVGTGIKFGNGEHDLESFDGLDTSNDEKVKLAAINLVNQNIEIVKDGIFSLCTTKKIGADVTGLSLETLSPQIIVGSSNKGGLVMGGKKMSLLPNINDEEIFDAATSRLIPILRETGDYKTVDSLVVALPTEEVINGETITTAPIAVGSDINLRALCKSSSFLATYGSQANLSETLSKDGGLSAIIVKVELAGKTNYLRLSVDGQNTRYTDTTSGRSKDLTLSYKSTIPLKLSEIAASGILHLGTDTAVLATTDLTYNIQVGVTVNVNTDAMIMDILPAAVKLNSVLDSSGAAIASSAGEYTTAKAAVDGMELIGLDMRQSLSNTNNADKGVIIDMDSLPVMYPVAYKTPVTIQKSVLDNVPTEVIAGYLVAASITNAAFAASEVYRKLEATFAAINKHVVNGFVIGVNPDGVGSEYIKSMYIKDTIAATDRNTMRSGQTSEDVAQYIMDNILIGANRMYTESALNKTINVVGPGEKVTLEIVTDATTASYLSRAKSDNEEFDVRISTSSKYNKRIVCTFKVGTEVNEATSIVLVEAPDAVYKGIETGGNSTDAVTKVVPRRGLYVNSFLFLDYTVTGITEAFK